MVDRRRIHQENPDLQRDFDQRYIFIDVESTRKSLFWNGTLIKDMFASIYQENPVLDKDYSGLNHDAERQGTFRGVFR